MIRTIRSTHQITESINVSFDEKGDIASESSRSEPVLTGARVSEQLHSSAIQNDQASDLSNTQTDLDILFENFYNEYFEAPNQSASVSGVNANMPIQISDTSTDIPSNTTPDSHSSPIIISTDSSASTHDIFDTSDGQSLTEEVEEQQSENESVEPESVNDQEIIPHVTKWTAHHQFHKLLVIRVVQSEPDLQQQMNVIFQCS